MKEKRIKEIKLFLLEKMLYLFSSEKTIDELKEFFLKGYGKNTDIKIKTAVYGYGLTVIEKKSLDVCLFEIQVMDNLTGGFTIKIEYSGLLEDTTVEKIAGQIKKFAESMNKISNNFLKIILKEEQPLRVAPDGSLKPSQPFLFLS